MARSSSDVEALQAQPDPLEPRTGEVERYVAGLQELARSDAELARRLAWDQIRLAGARAGSRRSEAHESLNAMFRLGGTPEPALDGPYRGILVTPITTRATDPLLRAVASAWMPWLGKRFDEKTATGDNLLARGARLPARALWPGYRLEDSGTGHYAAFRFRTYLDAGKLDPDRQVLKIDYDSEDNPKLLIRSILDELVQVVPGAYLGKVLLRRDGAEGEAWRLLGYFALEPPATARVEEPAGATAVPEPAPLPA